MYREEFAAGRWTKVEDKVFEAALVTVPEESPDRWRVIGGMVGKSPEEVRDHYEALLRDVDDIDSGRVGVPPCWEEEEEEKASASASASAGQIFFVGEGGGTAARHGETERKKGTPWTEDEHKRFLIGLQQFGKGDWRSISRNVVVTRTPTQVASHAQKFFLRQNAGKKDRKRQSIHDIKTVDATQISLPIDQNYPPVAAQVPQTQVMQQMPPPNQLLNQGGSMAFPNYGYSM